MIRFEGLSLWRLSFASWLVTALVLEVPVVIIEAWIIRMLGASKSLRPSGEALPWKPALGVSFVGNLASLAVGLALSLLS